MKKLLDKLMKQIRVNKRFMLFLSIVAIIGVLAGAIFVIILDSGDKLIIKDYINTFMNNIVNNKLDYIYALKNSFITTIFVILVVWLFGFSIVGIPIVILLLFSKAFVIGFSIGSAILNYKFKGLVLSIVMTFPHQIIMLIGLMVLSTYSISLSIKLLNCILKRSQMDFKAITSKYLFILVFVMVIGVLYSLYDTFALPFIIKLLMPIIS